MPIMDGLTATKIIKGLTSDKPYLNQFFKVIIVTAFTDSEDEHMAMKSGADYYMTKPINKLKLNNIFEHFYFLK